MTSFKILYNRPHSGKSQSDELMDFDRVLLKVEQARRTRRWRNAVIIFICIVTGILITIYYYQGQQAQTGKPGTGNSVGYDSADVHEPVMPEDSAHAENKSGIAGQEAVIPDSSGQNFTSVTKKAGPENEINRKLPEQKLIPARPICGFDSLYSYFREKLRYPEGYTGSMPEGKVVIGFSISNKGKTENVQVISSLNLVLDSVAINSVKNMPSWEPARLNGKPIVSRHSIPLVFNIDSVDIY